MTCQFESSNADQVSELRKLPSVDRLLGTDGTTALLALHGHDLTVGALRQALEGARTQILSGAPAPDTSGLIRSAGDTLAAELRPTLRRVINATGVIVHTNLGRAPLSAAARQAMAEAALGYTNLEYDLEAGARGSRYLHAEPMLQRLTGAEAALVVNNNAAGIYLVLAALAPGREVVISRGQLVEIGGGFRIPDVLRQSGAKLVEVGATNRTHLRDYAAAIGPETALLLRVHSSNFKQIGFVSEVPLAELVVLASEHGLPVVDDLGSGTLLDTTVYGLAGEPTVQTSVSAGAGLVCFSGDKLLGGPQAGIIVGRRDLVERIRRHPLSRAVRVDKVTLAALQATLLHYVRGEAIEQVPVWRMIAAPLAELRARAAGWVTSLQAQGMAATVVDGQSTIGGGALPGEFLATTLVALNVPPVTLFLARLRQATPSVIARIEDDRVLLDPRTVLPEEEQAFLRALIETAAASNAS